MLVCLVACVLVCLCVSNTRKTKPCKDGHYIQEAIKYAYTKRKKNKASCIGGHYTLEANEIRAINDTLKRT